MHVYVLMSGPDLQTESLHFKNRILDFFDVYARRQAQNPLVVDTIMPLLNLIRSSGSSEGELANKAAGILRSRIGKAKDVPTTLQAETASRILNSIHDLARKAPSADFSSLCSVCSLFIARSIETSTSSSPENPANEAYRATLADFMTRKSSAVHPAFILDYIRRFPIQAWPLRADLCKYITSGASVNAYRQTQAYNMLQTLSQQLGSIVKAVGPDPVGDFVKQASGDVFDTLESASDASSDWNAARLKEVIKFALQLARSSRSALPQMSISATWDKQRLAEVTINIKEGERTKEMKSVHGLLQQLAALTSKGERKEKAVKADGGKVDGTNTEHSPQSTIALNGDTYKEERSSKPKRNGDRPQANGNSGNPEGNAMRREKKRKSEEGPKSEEKSGRESNGEAKITRKKHKSSSKSISA